MSGALAGLAGAAGQAATVVAGVNAITGLVGVPSPLAIPGGGFGASFTSFASFGFNPATQAFGLSARRLMALVPDCAITESHSDRLIVTRHPVESGSLISDHAYLDPPTVNLRWGWTESMRGEWYAKSVYNNLRTIQSKRLPVVLTTGKRSYDNMVIESISETTDAWTEYCLIVDIVCRQVFIVTTQVIRTGSGTQAQPGQTQPATNVGKVAPSVVQPQGISSTPVGGSTDLAGLSEQAQVVQASPLQPPVQSDLPPGWA